MGREPRRRQVAVLADELAAAGAGNQTSRISEWAVTLPIALALTGQLERFGFSITDQLSTWGPASRLLFDGRFEEAADALGEFGARSEQALARLLAGRALIERGHVADGEAQLRQAIEFWRPRRAAAYLAQAESAISRTA